MTYDETDYSVTSDASASSLPSNKFVKIVPKTTNAELGQPLCGDGGEFAFYFSKPAKSKANGGAKLIVELLGGGACWSADTCNQQQDQLKFPEFYDSLLGYSCSEVAAAFKSNNNNEPISMLCASTVGNVDLSTYSTVIIPYCTQDVHIGDSEASYNGYNSVVYHHGAHNVKQTLEWVFKNFPSPENVILTGCSAGATALPVVYSYMHSKYNSLFKRRSTQISVLADSATYLTPPIFLRNYFDNWKPSTVFNRLNYKEEYSEDEDGTFSTDLWDYIINQGDSRDGWAFISHTEDPVSSYYYELMGQGDNNYNNNYNNYNNNNNYNNYNNNHNNNYNHNYNHNHNHNHNHNRKTLHNT